MHIMECYIRQCLLQWYLVYYDAVNLRLEQVMIREYCYLHRRDDRTGLQLTLPRDKTSSEPVVILIARTDTSVCANDTMLRYLHYRHDYFPRTHNTANPLICHHNGTVVKRRELTQALISCARDAQLPYWSLYKGHSFRRGDGCIIITILYTCSTVVWCINI